MSRTRLFTFVICIASVCTPGVLRSQALWSGLLANGRAVDWSSAGASSISNRTTICTTLGASGQSASYAQSVTAAQIVSALQSCAGKGQVVYLNPGTYKMTSTLFGGGTATPSNVTLRGAGPTQTILTWTATSNNCNGLGATAFCIYNGDSGSLQYSSNVLNWTGGYTQGSSTITLGSAVSGALSNLQVGSLLALNQLDNSSDTGGWYICGTTGSNGSCSQQGIANAWPGRAQTQMVTVTAISGSSITISPGIYGSSWSSSQTPYATFSSKLPVSGFGLESLQINTQQLGDIQAMVETMWASQSWIKNVSLINNVATNSAARKHVEVFSSSHITVRDSYMYGSSPSSEGYGLDFIAGTCDSLGENNIFQHMATGTILETGCGNVFGYNYAVDNFYTGAGTAPSWQQCDAFHHDGGDFFNLWEGQEGICASFDDIHGTAAALTIFRSHFSGHDPATLCPGGGTACGTVAKNGNTAAIGIMAYSRYSNIVANVLGTSGYHSNYRLSPSSASDCGNATQSSLSVLWSGYSRQGGILFGNSSSGCDVGTGFQVNNDLLTGSTNSTSTLMLWGNYDVVTAAVRANTSENGSGAATLAALSAPSSSWSAYPSLYLTAKPSWWLFPSGNSATPWPAVGPDVTGGNVSGVGGYAYLNPAANCFLNVLGGKTNGSSAVLSFDATTCYGSSTQNKPPAPANLSGTVIP